VTAAHTDTIWAAWLSGFVIEAATQEQLQPADIAELTFVMVSICFVSGCCVPGNSGQRFSLDWNNERRQPA
jgi:hypothetical protein